MPSKLDISRVEGHFYENNEMEGYIEYEREKDFYIYK